MRDNRARWIAFGRQGEVVGALAIALTVSLGLSYLIILAVGRLNFFDPKWEIGPLLEIAFGLLVNFLFVIFYLQRQTITPRAARVEQDVQTLRFTRRDPLTGLASQHLLNEAIAARMVEDQDTTLILIQLSGFGAFRATHGYEVGDEVLQRVGKRLLDISVNDSRNMARIDGETFAIVLETADRGLIETTALHLSRGMADPFSAAGRSFEIEFRIGIATTTLDVMSTNDLTRTAQVALEQAKAGRGAQWCYYNVGMETARIQAEQIKRDLPAAIANGEILPFYQPIVDLRSRRWIKLEVLARWLHPTLGRISPDQFIPIAEALDLASAITDALLQQVSFDAALFPDDMVFSFNSSPEQLRSMICFADIAKRATDGGLPASRIEVAITERALLENLDVVREVIRSLQSVGTRVVLDDFGVGLSNFFYLCELPFDSVKIDKKFVLGMLHDRRAAACVGAMILTGRSLGIEMVAEGIEEPQVVETLLQLGCRQGQGYLFGRPACAADIHQSYLSAEQQWRLQ